MDLKNIGFMLQYQSMASGLSWDIPWSFVHPREMFTYEEVQQQLKQYKLDLPLYNFRIVAIVEVS